VAQVKMAGASSFTMTYQYETINGQNIAAQAGLDRSAKIPGS
jgi:hypothetical protein